MAALPDWYIFSADIRTMKKIFILLFVMVVVSVLSSPAYCQILETLAKKNANEMAKAVIAKDVDKIAGYLPPKLLAEAGGKEKMMIARDTINKMMQQFGAEIKKVTIGEPAKVIFYKNQLQTTIPQTTEVKFMSGKIIMESTLIAISEDKGMHWYFVDNAIYRGEKLKSALPDISPQLVIPPMKKPRIEAVDE